MLALAAANRAQDLQRALARAAAVRADLHRAAAAVHGAAAGRLLAERLEGMLLSRQPHGEAGGYCIWLGCHWSPSGSTWEGVFAPYIDGKSRHYVHGVRCTSLAAFLGSLGG